MRLHRDYFKTQAFKDEVTNLKNRIKELQDSQLLGIKSDIELEQNLLTTIDGINIYYSPNRLVILASPMDVDADGSPNAYNPQNTGLDYNQNAKDEQGRWVGIALDINGNPFIQDSNDPSPGYYVSTTSYQLSQYHVSSPDRYLNAETIPYLVLPATIIEAVPEICLGSSFYATNLQNEKFVNGIVGDAGPSDKFGEASMFTCSKLGLDSNPKDGGTDDKIIKITVLLGTQWNKDYPLQPS